MKKIPILIICLLVMTGCVSMRKATEPRETLELKNGLETQEEIQEGAQVEGAPENVEIHPELENIKGEELEEYVEKKGVIFAKTNFQGLLETRYVKFLFEDQEDENHKFQLHIGETSGQKKFPWEVKTVKPGYFFVELPVSRYKITSVTIPVGSTTATEEMDVDLEVLPDAICYVGTLKMVGTKERIKLGGVPVIRPGFEFTVEILDEREEGSGAFTQNYPNFPHAVSIKLMDVNQVTN